MVKEMAVLQERLISIQLIIQNMVVKALALLLSVLEKDALEQKKRRGQGPALITLDKKKKIL